MRSERLRNEKSSAEKGHEESNDKEGNKNQEVVRIPPASPLPRACFEVRQIRYPVA